MRCSNYDEWLQKVVSAHNKETSPIYVPATTYFTMRKADRKIVGSIQLRHELDDDLRKRGGHIGYGICPSERNKGYGTIQLAMVLDKARELHIPRVMISCDKTNLGSARVAVNNGGKLEWEGFDEEDGYIQIYWIELI
jgi:predicted acetyltransferase